MIENNILLNSIKLIIIIKFIDVLFGDKFIKIIFKLLLIANIILIIQKIKVIFNVNEILWEFEYKNGLIFNKLIIKINIIIILNK